MKEYSRDPRSQKEQVNHATYKIFSDFEVVLNLNLDGFQLDVS